VRYASLIALLVGQVVTADGTKWTFSGVDQLVPDKVPSEDSQGASSGEISQCTKSGKGKKIKFSIYYYSF